VNRQRNDIDEHAVDVPRPPLALAVLTIAGEVLHRRHLLERCR
jgi:hypothetical protein